MTTSSMLLAGCLFLLTATPLSAQPNAKPVTFARDIAPLLQQKCQNCHRPGSVAPMSFLTYAETRPWAKSIKQRVALGEMPPWHLDKTVGIQRYKNDRSLTAEQIDTFVRWVDAGAPLGDPKDMPPPIAWPTNEDTWTIGTPDLIVSSPEHVMYPKGTDWWVDHIVGTGLTEDRYIKAIETKPSKEGRRIVHHAVTSIIDEDNPDGYLSEYAVGKYGDIFAENTGRLLKAGSKLKFNMHYFAIGEEIRDVTSVAFIFYPKGYVPKHKVVPINVGVVKGQLYKELDIPPNTITRHDGYFRLPRPARLLSYQPHMHMRGKAMTMEAVYADGRAEPLSAVDRFDFNWHVAYVYEDDVAPLLPAGTVLHTIGIHDNTTANRRNPDPTIWVGSGMRSIDDMLQCHVLLTYLDDDEFERMVAERKAKEKIQTSR